MPGIQRSDDAASHGVIDGGPIDEMTITELARRAGMSVRNIRAHQSRGLLPPPIHRGRQAVYDDTHRRRLLRIRALQAEGHNLASIASMLDEAEGRPTPMQRLALAPLLEADEVVLTWAEMAEMFNLTPSRSRLKQAIEVGLIRDLGDGRYAAPSRKLLEATKALVDRGMAILDVYAMQVEMISATRQVAERFVRACQRIAVEPYASDTMSEHLDDVRLRFEQLRTLTAAVLASTFSISVRRATEALLSQRDAPAATPD